MDGYGPPEPALRHRFTGKERDAESGLDYFGARYLSAAQGRFTGADPVLNLQATIPNPQRWNRYAYVSNNPLAKVDPDGADERHVLAAQGEAAAVEMLRKEGFTVALDPGRKAVQAGGFDFVVVRGAEVVVGVPEVLLGDNKACRSRGTVSSATALDANLRRNVLSARAELTRRLALGAVAPAEEAAIEAALRSLEKGSYQLVVTGAGGRATRVGAKLAAKGIAFRALAGLLVFDVAGDVAALVLDASTANVGADFRDETERANATVSRIHGRWKIDGAISAGELDYLRRLGQAR
jgi:RHS repeat-associated protein